MRFVKQVRILAGLALAGAASITLADTATPETVVVEGTAQGAWNCNEATAERARSLGDKASQDGAYQRAGECYLIAGEHALANQAFARASAQASGDTSRRLAANLSDVKAQARQMKQAFQRR
ncbi:MAG: hypothetical protein ACJ8R9_02125 [Steroidobacteraceae bacterium]